MEAGERITLLNRLSKVVSRCAMMGCASFAMLVSVGAASAEDITLLNPSFELPSVPFPTDPNPDQADFVLLDIQGWNKTGPFGNDPRAPVGMQDTGVFLNLPFDPGTGSLVQPTSNADGNQLAFMVVNTDSFLPGSAEITISQTTSTAFEAGKAYSFKMDIGSSFVAPLGALLGGSPVEALDLIIGYGGTGESITPVATRTVLATELTLDFATFNAPLTEFEVVTDVLDGAHAAIGEDLRVMIKLTDGNSGAFNLDNARLSVVPEPGSMAILATLGVLALRRRR